MTAPTKLPPADTGRCGEYAGYRRHIRAGEEPCDTCTAARRRREPHWRLNRRTGVRITAEDRQAAQAAPPLTSGHLACTNLPHPFRAGFGQGVSTQCAECWGWRDDPRHPVIGGPVAGR